MSTRNPRQNTFGVASVPRGPATRANSNSNGAAPSLAFALVIDPVDGARQLPHPGSSIACASVSFASTSPYPDRMNSQHARVNTIISRAGSSR